ncbi:MAG: FAS1-like dehydratase domain-containing protein [Polymorphobacter sp.]
MGDWDAWIGRTSNAADTLTPGLLTRFRATIDSTAGGLVAAPGIHWCLCLPDTPTAGLDVDGHPRRGIDLPPVPLPRRMWAASQVDFHAPVAVGATVTRQSTIASITAKDGSTGKLVFVEIDHRTHADGVLAVSERQTLVFRDAPGAATAPPVAVTPPVGWPWQRTVVPDPRLLLRYSALTFNSHRIHYDQPYATGTEGYRGLVVHGPLLATLLLDLLGAAAGGAPIASFNFRGLGPAIADEPLYLCGRRDADGFTLLAQGPFGPVMTAQARVTD